MQYGLTQGFSKQLTELTSLSQQCQQALGNCQEMLDLLEYNR